MHSQFHSKFYRVSDANGSDVGVGVRKCSGLTHNACFAMLWTCRMHEEAVTTERTCTASAWPVRPEQTVSYVGLGVSPPV